ncbi:MAG: ABC transporter ATP-binding protein [Candidatus Heimdallarchaeota archaeon]|nr:ABC transporter ATP-binding protein [Candidatus Heimdallarchaeota archaeon]MCK4253218.1 ABC transporter ATP-binding protein [Candidatus Heimdallarchaeota archaeon]
MGHGTGRSARRFAVDKHDRARSTRVLVGSLSVYIKKYLWMILLVALISILYSVISIINPLIIGAGLDTLAVSSDTTRLVIILSATFLVLTVFGWVINSISTRLQAKMNSKMLHEVRSDLYEKLSYSDMAYLKNEQSGNITARVNSDTTELATALRLSTAVVSQILVIVSAFIILMVTNWIIGLITLSAIPIAFAVAATLSFFARKIVLGVRRAFGIVSGKMAEGLEGIAIAKAFNREDELAIELRELNQQHYKYSRKFGFLMMFVMPFMTALSYAMFIAIIYISGWINQSSSIGIGDIYVAIQLSQAFLFPMVMLSMMFPQLESALGAMDRIIDIFEAKPAVADAEDAKELLTDDDHITIDNLSFAYEKEIYVLKNINFTANPGEMIAVVGHTGAGKTTLFSSLLTRFYDVNEGSIKIGKQDIKSVTQSSLRKAIGLVTQEPFLFTGTVMENILYGAPDATVEDVYKISKRINADEFIAALPKGYDTQVVEGGKKLSAGQRQIITVARTMLSNPRILVLDEATSRLDAYTESLVQAAQRELFKGRTTFVIAHRLSTIKDADRIMVLDHGKLMEVGTHNELMKVAGIYADLYNTYYVHQGLDDITIRPEDLGIETLDKDIQTKKGAANKMAMGQGPGMKGKKPSKREMKKMKKEGVSPMKQQPSKGLTPEMIENLKERAKNLNPEDIKAMMKKMKKLTGEDFPEDLKKMLIQISEKHKNKK